MKKIIKICKGEKMCKFIGAESLAANALLKLYKEDEQANSISLDSLCDYGIEVMKIFDEQNIEAVILFSENEIVKLVHDYSDCFELKNERGKQFLYFKNDDINYFIRKFIIYWTNDIICAFSKAKIAKK